MHPHWFKLAPSLKSRAFTDESCAELCKTQHQFHSELCIPLCILKPGIWGQYLQDILSIFWIVICYSNLGSNQGWHPLQYINTILKLLERFLYYTTVRVSNKIFPSTYMEAVALTVKATQARQHQHSSLRLSCYLLMWAVAYLVKWNWCCSACVTHPSEFVALSVNLPNNK